MNIQCATAWSLEKVNFKDDSRLLITLSVPLIMHRAIYGRDPSRGADPFASVETCFQVLDNFSEGSVRWTYPNFLKNAAYVKATNIYIKNQRDLCSHFDTIPVSGNRHTEQTQSCN